MKVRAVHRFVTLVTALAAVSLYTLDWSLLSGLSNRAFLGLVALVALAFLSESLAVSVTYGKKAGHSSIIFIPLLACQLLFGTPASTVLVLVAYSAAEIFLRKKELVRATFNISQITLAAVIAGFIFTTVGGEPLTLGRSTEPRLTNQLFPFIAFAVVFLGTNHFAVSLAISLDQNISFRKVWKNRAGRSAANTLYDLLISPAAIVVAFLYLELGFLGILVSILPILFIRHAYLTTYKLREANRDLLKALVKAIETRDPYTSGHSLRVSNLAKQIAEQLGLGRKKIEAVEAGALLHDIGKIDAIYTEILQKPGSLTDEERKIIESHVYKGAELLQSLSSFGDDVTNAVKHHHERIDGKGYPDGLKGDDIPIGARIIKVCDAIDAMLSDRPYRKALDLSSVREQLTTYKGTQFDSSIVDLVVGTDILERHQKEVNSVRKGQSEESSKETSRPVPVNI